MLPSAACHLRVPRRVLPSSCLGGQSSHAADDRLRRRRADRRFVGPQDDAALLLGAAAAERHVADVRVYHQAVSSH